MSKPLLAAVALVIVAGLAACGGGDGGGGFNAGSSGGTVTPPSSSSSSTSSSASSSASSTSSSSSSSSSASSSSSSSSSSSASGPGTKLAGCDIFPSQAIFNTPIGDGAQFPVHASNATWHTKVRGDGGVNLHVHLDMGMSENQAQPDTYYGIPYNTLDGTVATTNWSVVSFNSTDPHDSNTGYADESDCAVPSGTGYVIHNGCQATSSPRFPFPLDAALKIEGGACNVQNGTCSPGDSHVLVLEQGQCRLWESYYTYKGAQGWHVSAIAAWNLTSFAMRPDGWTSADAAGLPIMPLLLKADEANSGTITHAFRVTFNSAVANAYVWPASHKAGSGSTANIPFGALLRLRSDFVIPANWTTQAKAIAKAMQTYGLYVADIGSDLYIQGEPSAKWQDATFTQLQGITFDKFEFVDTGAITRNPQFSSRSYRAQW